MRPEYFKHFDLFETITLPLLNNLPKNFLDIVELMIDEARFSEMLEEGSKNIIMPNYLDSITIFYKARDIIEMDRILKPIKINDINSIVKTYKDSEWAYSFSSQIIYGIERGDIVELMKKVHRKIEGLSDDSDLNGYTATGDFFIQIIVDLKSMELIAISLCPSVHLMGLTYPNPHEKCRFIAYHRHTLKAISTAILKNPNKVTIIYPTDDTNEILTFFFILYGLLEPSINIEILASSCSEELKINFLNYLLFGSWKMFQVDKISAWFPGLESSMKKRTMYTGIALGFFLKEHKIRAEFRFDADKVNGGHIDFAVDKTQDNKSNLICNLLHHHRIKIENIKPLKLERLFGRIKKNFPEFSTSIRKK